MDCYTTGQRVALEFCFNGYGDLAPGDLGRVVDVTPDGVQVKWDNGTTRWMYPRQGDVLQVVDEETPDTEPRKWSQTRTWTDLSFSEKHHLQFLLDHDHALGRVARFAAARDIDLAVWLMDAGNAFADETSSFPRDLGSPMWRTLYDNQLDPRAAAKVALHRIPMARIVNEQLVCPVCGTADRIVERDSATRHNELHVSGGEVFASNGDSDFYTDATVCDVCDTPVRLPKPIVDWS